MIKFIRKNILILTSSFLLGVAVDFLFNGVLKIVWIAIYGTVYLTLAGAVYSYLQEKFEIRLGIAAGSLLLLGCLLGHILFVGQREERIYPMTLLSDSQIVLQSPQLAQTLYVTSENVGNALEKMDRKNTVPVTIEVIKDYGCIWSFKVRTIAGVDVMNDPKSTWAWRPQVQPDIPKESFSGLNEENQRRPWCHLSWF